MRFPLNGVLVLPVLASLAGCQALDPYTNEGRWRPGGANEQNLAVMLVHPEERIQGTGSTAAGTTAVAAIERLRADKLKPLPDSGLARIVTVPNGASGN
ncbi:hypothetical protein [Roseicella frigidaeris]|uniref:DUF3576 domain-containing protein n=1 Tax=Roseicella frigidaeris TaxID=2230885 RepID=A0A327MB33_9PROT|nr:hypothetical protein [Roseicella frigidaeris]RAI59354.1 hypothetical protein DOO78_10025 [Roseicella frigidaeris]